MSNQPFSLPALSSPKSFYQSLHQNRNDSYQFSTTYFQKRHFQKPLLIFEPKTLCTFISVSPSTMELVSFNEGDVVEVTSQEEGFLGSWYIATVVRSSRGTKKKKKKKNYLVEYHSLIDEQGNPLRETIDASNLRPRPPSHIIPFYQLNEEIDAFYNDGWWQGVIVEVLEDKRFKVFFASTRDEVDFGKSELRSHLEWVDGAWARCQDREKMEPVEVMFDDENCQGAWFPATVLREIANESFLVEYMRSRFGDNVGPVRVIVPSQHLRPFPPRVAGKKYFRLQQKVDAYYDFGWWNGVVTKILARGLYIVFLKHQKKERVFNQSALRVSMKWTDNKWHQDSVETLTIPQSESGVESSVPTGSTALNSEMNTPIRAIKENFKKISRSTSKNLYQKFEISTPSFSNQGISSRKGTIDISYKKVMEGDTANIPNFTVGSSTGVESQDGLNMLIPKGKRKFYTRRTPTNPKFSDPLIEECIMKKCASLSSDIRATNDLQCDNGNQLSVELTPNHVPAGEHHEVIDLSETEMPREKGQSLVQHPLPMKQLMESIKIKQQGVGMMEKQTVHYVKGMEKQPVNEESGRIKRQKLNSEKGKCGRPRKEDSKTEESLEGKNQEKSVLGNPTALDSTIAFSKEGLEHEEAPIGEEIMDIIVIPECAELSSHNAGEHEPVDALLEQSNCSSTRDNRGLSTDNSLIPDEVNTKSQAMETLQLQNPLAIVECSYSMEEQTFPDECDNDPGDELNESYTYGGAECEEGCIRGMTDIVIPEECIEQLSHVAAGHTTLSGSLENSNPLVMENRGVSPDNELMLNEATTQEAATERLQQNACNRTPSTQENDTAIESYLVDDTENICTTPGQGDDAAPTQSLPFIKSSPFWTTVDSMDAMQLIPQHPHFHPLEQYNEDLREGLAIGWMISFANLVTRTLEIQFDGSQKDLEEKLMSLTELEKYGFTVQPLRSKLEEMREINDKCRKLNDDSTAVAKQIMEQRDEMNKLDTEIDDLKESIAQLDKTLHSIIMKKDANGATVAELETKADAIEESIQRSRHEFDSFRAAPW